MNARTLLPLAILAALVSVSLAAHAADSPPRTGASLPDTDAQAKARAALYAPEPVPVQSAPQTSAAPPKSKPTNVETQPAIEEPVVEETAAAAEVTLPASQPDNEAQARARAALYAAEPAPASIEPTPFTQSTPALAVVVPASNPAPQATTPGTNPLTAGMAAPSLPTTASQQQQLNTLLQQYRSDQISASQYHTQRAEILAGK